MSRSNQTKHIKWQESCKCECKLNSSVCNNKQRWNEDKCRCESKELVDKQECDKLNHVVLENTYIIKIVNVQKK